MLISRRVAGARTTATQRRAKRPLDPSFWPRIVTIRPGDTLPTRTHANTTIAAAARLAAVPTCYSRRVQEKRLHCFEAVFVRRPPRTYVRRDTPWNEIYESTTVFFFFFGIAHLLPRWPWTVHVGLLVNDPTVCIISVNLLFFFCVNFLKTT